MAKNPLHDLSLKDGLDDSSLLRALIDSLPEYVYVKDAGAATSSTTSRTSKL